MLAFDTGPANMLIDALVGHFSCGRARFDDGARRALAGRAIPALLDELMRDSYLRVAPPKSTGREYYGADYLKKVLALGRKYRAKPDDLIRCATIFTALSVVDALNRFVLPRVKIHQLIVSGGGARNPLIMAQLGAALPGVEVALLRGWVWRRRRRRRLRLRCWLMRRFIGGREMFVLLPERVGLRYWGRFVMRCRRGRFAKLRGLRNRVLNSRVQEKAARLAR